MGNSEVTLSFKTIQKKQFQAKFNSGDTVGLLSDGWHMLISQHYYYNMYNNNIIYCSELI